MSKLSTLTTAEIRNHVKELEAKPDRTAVQDAALLGFTREIQERRSQEHSMHGNFFSLEPGKAR
jgi:hypothetical protein